VTPFCSCSSIPLFIGFLEAGIPLGVTLSFLIASPMINEVAVIVLASVIGVKMTAIYVAAGLTVPLPAASCSNDSSWNAGRGVRVEDTHGRSATRGTRHLAQGPA